MKSSSGFNRQSNIDNQRFFRPQAVVFDLDGVLLDSMPLHCAAWRRAGKVLGLRVSAREIYRREGEVGRITARDLLRMNGRPPRPQDAARLLALKEASFQDSAGKIPLISGALTLLRTLHSARLPLALVTGTARQEVERVLPPSWRRYFQCLMTADDVRHGKPHPEPYRRAFAALRVPAEACWVIENAPYGIRSARAADAGYIVAIASSLPSAELKEADWICPTLRDCHRQYRRG